MLTNDEVLERASDLLDPLLLHPAAHPYRFHPVLSTIPVMETIPRTTTLRKWFDSHRLGDTVYTFQFGKLHGLWHPGPRVLNELRATSAMLGGSYIDYEGSRVLLASDDYIVVYYDTFRMVVMYSDFEPMEQM